MPNGTPGPLAANWIDQAARIVTTVGFPVVVAALLLWWVLFRFQEQIALISARLEHNATVASALIDETKKDTEVTRQWATDNVAELRKQTVELHEQTNALHTIVRQIEQKGGR